MSLRDKLEIRDTGARMPGDPYEPRIDQVTEESTTLRDYDFRNVYRTSVTVHHQWAAAPGVETVMGKLDSERAIAEFLYGGVLGRLRRLRSALGSRDYRTAMRYLDEMEKEMQW